MSEKIRIEVKKKRARRVVRGEERRPYGPPPALDEIARVSAKPVTVTVLLRPTLLWQQPQEGVRPSVSELGPNGEGFFAYIPVGVQGGVAAGGFYKDFDIYDQFFAAPGYTPPPKEVYFGNYFWGGAGDTPAMPISKGPFDRFQKVNFVTTVLYANYRQHWFMYPLSKGFAALMPDLKVGGKALATDAAFAPVTSVEDRIAALDLADPDYADKLLRLQYEGEESNPVSTSHPRFLPTMYDYFPRHATLKLKTAGGWRVTADNPWVEPFDPFDTTNYKVTREVSFDAEEKAAPRPSGAKELHVALMARLWRYDLTYAWWGFMRQPQDDTGVLLHCRVNRRSTGYLPAPAMAREVCTVAYQWLDSTPGLTSVQEGGPPVPVPVSAQPGLYYLMSALSIPAERAMLDDISAGLALDSVANNYGFEAGRSDAAVTVTVAETQPGALVGAFAVRSKTYYVWRRTPRAGGQAVYSGPYFYPGGGFEFYMKHLASTGAEFNPNNLPAGPTFNEFPLPV